MFDRGVLQRESRRSLASQSAETYLGTQCISTLDGRSIGSDRFDVSLAIHAYHLSSCLIMHVVLNGIPSAGYMLLPVDCPEYHPATPSHS